MIGIDQELQPADLLPALERFWRLSGEKILGIEAGEETRSGSPVFTVGGRYTSQSWTEWTQGFQYGSALLQFDATNDEVFLEIGRDKARLVMAPHVTHMGVHDHGFNNVSTYGNLWRLMNEGRVAERAGERDFLELALRCSGAVQARRWTAIAEGGGFVYSFNGPHSLFADTIRSMRSLALAHLLGHELLEEHDERIDLLERLLDHVRATARYTVYYGEGRDAWDERGRVAHESLFNVRDGRYRCPSTQQGYSPFTTWTRAQAWVLCGCAELAELMGALPPPILEPHGGRDGVLALLLKPARACADHLLQTSPHDGIPYWDTGAPGLQRLGAWGDRPADPFNAHEPVDSSAAAISSQGLLRLGRVLDALGEAESGRRYWQAGLTVLRTLLDTPYLSADSAHEGLLLHAVYHRPLGWDHVPKGSSIPHGEACMWGDYHVREAALLVQRVARDEPHHTFFTGALP